MFVSMLRIMMEVQCTDVGILVIVSSYCHSEIRKDESKLVVLNYITGNQETRFGIKEST